MKRRNYWRYLSQSIREKKPGPLPNDPVEMVSHIRDYFQKGMILVLGGDKTRGRRFLSAFDNNFSILGARSNACGDWIARYITHTLLHDAWDNSFILTGMNQLMLKIKRHLAKHLSRDMNEVIDETPLQIFDRRSRQMIVGNSTPGCKDRTAYYELADMLLECARLMLLVYEIDAVLKIMESANRLYLMNKKIFDSYFASILQYLKQRRITIDEYLQRLDTGKIRATPGAAREIETTLLQRERFNHFGELFNEQLELMKHVRGDLIMVRSEMLKEKSYGRVDEADWEKLALRTGGISRDLQTRLDSFFIEYLVSHNRNELTLSFTQEMEWILVKVFLYRLHAVFGPGMNAADMFKKSVEIQAPLGI